MRVSRREHEKGTCPLGHASLDAPAADEHSLRDAAAQLQINPMAVQRAQKKALAALRQQLVGAG